MKKKSGFTLVEIMIVVAIIALLTAIAIPAFLKYRQDAQASLCVNNLRLIKHGKATLAIKYNWTNGVGDLNTTDNFGHDWGATAATQDAQWWTLLDPYMDGTNLLQCPVAPNASQHYDYMPVGENPLCPQYVADSTNFADHILTD